MAGGGEIPADIIIQQDYASKLARLVWNDEINDWVLPNRPPLLHHNIVLLSLGSECQQVTLLATRQLRGTGCGRVARLGEFLFMTSDCYRSRRFFYFEVLAAQFVPCCDARSVEYSRTLPRCASCKTQTASTIIRKISILPAVKKSAVLLYRFSVKKLPAEPVCC